MNSGPNRPAGDSGGRGRRRRRGRRGPGQQGPQQNPGQQGQTSPSGQQAHSGQQGRPAQGPVGQNRRHGGPARPHRQKQRGPRSGAMNVKTPDAHLYSAPMDHSYRAAMQNGNGNGQSRGGRPSFQQGRQFFQPEPEPLPGNAMDAPRIFAYIEDLFFLAKINETARKLNLKVDFVKTDKDVLDAVEQTGEKPSLIIVDLNNLAIKPLTLIPKLKAKLKKETNIIGFLSHLQGDLKLKASEAGCDMVLPRSAFSANLPQLLRRHAATEEPDEAVQ
jgi:CheY-like chemotaxis protein